MIRTLCEAAQVCKHTHTGGGGGGGGGVLSVYFLNNIIIIFRIKQSSPFFSCDIVFDTPTVLTAALSYKLCDRVEFIRECMRKRMRMFVRETEHLCLLLMVRWLAGWLAGWLVGWLTLCPSSFTAAAAPPPPPPPPLSPPSSSSSSSSSSSLLRCQNWKLSSVRWNHLAMQ